MFGFVCDLDCLGNKFCYWFLFVGFWLYMIYLYSCFEMMMFLVFIGDVFYLWFYGFNF